MSEKIALQSQYNSKQFEINSCNAQLASLDDRIEAIKLLKEKFVELKSDLHDFKQNLKAEARESHEFWKGQLLNEHNDLFRGSLINDSLSTYIKNVDRNLDDLNNELMKLQNEIYSTEGLLGSLKASLNWISTKIDNLVN